MGNRIATSRIVVIGAGSSAKRYLEKYLDNNSVVAVLDSHGEGSLNGLLVRKMETITSLNYDRVVIASWAVNELADTLLRLGVNQNVIDVFLNDRDKLLTLKVWRQSVSPTSIAMGKTLYAFYDLSISYPTFDILGFICLAEIERKKRACNSVHFIIVAPASRTNMELLPLMHAQEQNWRIRNILFPCCYLLPACSGVSICSDREEAATLAKHATFLFPNNYGVEQPVSAWKFDLLIDQVDQGEEIGLLASSTTALQYTDHWVAHHTPPKKKIITITTRENTLQHLRNSDLEQWELFIDSLDKEVFFPIVIRDTEKAMSEPLFSGKYEQFNEAAFNLELRMALYETSYVNLGVNNGPSHLWVFNPKCNYLMFKQITNDYHHSSEQSFIDRKFRIGQNFPGSGPFQRFIWEEDQFEIIKREFDRLCQDIEQSKL